MTPVFGPRPALVKRTVRCVEHMTGSNYMTFHACWQHAHRLEDDTFDVPGAVQLEGAGIEEVKPNERDDAGTWCAFCE